MDNKPTTSKYSIKPYKCNHCPKQILCDTNHYGEIYITCPQCGKMSFSCMLECPADMSLPAKWTQTTLGNIVEIL